MTIFEINNKARALGMSYGQYVVRFGPFDAEPEEFERRCAQCGRVIPTKRICASNTQYCSETCRTRSIWDEVKRKEREKNGKTIVL